MLSDKYSEFYTDTQIFDEFLYPLCKPGKKEDKKKINLSTSEIKVPVREQSYNSVSSASTYNYQPEKVVDSDEEVNGKLLNSILKSKDSTTPSKRSSYVVQFNPEAPKPVTSKQRFAFRDEETDSEPEALEVKRGLTDTVSQKVKNIRDMGSSDEEEFVAPPKPKQKQPSYLKYTTREAYEAAESSESEVELTRCAPPAKESYVYSKKVKKVATSKPTHKRKSKISFGNGNEEDSHFKEDYKEISNSVLVLPPPQDLPMEPPMPPHGPGFIPMQNQFPPPPPHHLPHFPYPYPNYYGQVPPAAGPQPPFVPSAPVVPPTEEVVEENVSPNVPEEKSSACKKEKIEKISPILKPENQSTPVFNPEYDSSESEDEPINVYNVQTTTEVDESKVPPISNATLTLIGHNKHSPFPHHHHSKVGSLIESDEEIISTSYLAIKPKHVVYPESIKNAIETLLKMQDEKQRDNLIEKELFEKLKKWYEDTIKDQENSLFLFQKNLDILKGKYAKSRGIKHNQAEDIARKEHEIHILRDELRKLRNEYDDLLQKLDGQVKINEKQLIEIKKLNEQIKSLQKVNRDQKSCIDKQNAIIDDLEHKIHDQDRHIRDLDSYIKRQEKRILDLNKICSEQERKIEDQGYCVHEQQRKLDAIAATSHPIYIPHHHHHHRTVCPHVKRVVYTSSSSSSSSDDEYHYLPKRTSKRVIRSVVVPKKHRSKSKYETIEIVRDSSSSSSEDEYRRRKPIRIVVDSSSSSDEEMRRRERTERTTERTVVVEPPKNYQQNSCNNGYEVVERNVKIEKTSTSTPPPPPPPAQTSAEAQKIIKKTVTTTTTTNNQSSSSNNVNVVSPKINSAENSKIITTERNVSESSSDKKTEDYYYTDGKSGKTVHVVSSTVTTTKGGDSNGKKNEVEKKGEEYKKIETEKTVKVEVEKKKVEEEKKKAEEEKKRLEKEKKKAEEEKKKAEAAKKKSEEEKKKIEAEKKKAEAEKKKVEEEKKKAEAEKKKIEAEKKLEEESKKTVTTIVETTTNQEQAGSSGQNENNMNNYSNYTETTVETTYEVIRN